MTWRCASLDPENQMYLVCTHRPDGPPQTNLSAVLGSWDRQRAGGLPPGRPRPPRPPDNTATHNWRGGVQVLVEGSPDDLKPVLQVTFGKSQLDFRKPRFSWNTKREI